MKRKILKAKGGADASKADFKTPGTTASAPPSMGFGNPPPGSNTNNNTNNTNTTTSNKTMGKIPVIGPITAGLRIVQNLFTPSSGSYNKSRNLGGVKTHKTTQNVVPPVGGGNEGPQLCPDGTYPPCKTPETQIKPPAQKNMFLSDFKAYDEGGEVVISSNVDKSLL